MSRLDEAREWLNGYFVSIEESQGNCLLEYLAMLPSDEYARHIEFVAECLEHGVKPVHFADTIAEMWKEASDEIADNDESDEGDEWKRG